MEQHREISVFYRKFCYRLCFISLILLLYACPFSSTYKLDDEASLPVNESIIGKWATVVLDNWGKQRPVKMILSKRTDNEYNICFTGDLYNLKPYKLVDDDSIKGTAFMSLAVDKQFLNIEIKGRTYISELTYKNDMLSLIPLADGFTAKYIKSNAELRRAIEVHLKTRICPIIDEQFCLRDMVRVN